MNRDELDKIFLEKYWEFEQDYLSELVYDEAKDDFLIWLSGYMVGEYERKSMQDLIDKWIDETKDGPEFCDRVYDKIRERVDKGF